MSEAEDLIKRRELRFCHLHPDPNQAQSALLLLADAEGIHEITLVDELCLFIAYDVRVLTLESIELILTTLGYHLDNRLLSRMRRALYKYSEDTQRDNLGVSADIAENTTQVFIRSYTSHYHGCRDKRPDHWRKYL